MSFGINIPVKSLSWENNSKDKVFNGVAKDNKIKVIEQYFIDLLMDR